MVERDSLGKNIIYEKANKRTYKRVLPGQFVIHLRSFQGGFAYSSIEGITSPAYTVLQLLNRKKDTPYFWQIIFNSNRFIDDLKTVTYGIRDGKSISFNDFKTLKFKTPFLLEQQKISTFLTALNKLITLHQRKLELIKSIYWYYFKESVVFHSRQKITFSNEKWVQHKLKNIAERLDSDRIPITASKRVAGTTPYYGANGIQDYVNGYTHTGENILIAEDGANDISNYPIFLVKGNIWVNNHAHVIRSKSPEISNNFLVYALKAINYSQYLVGGSRAKLNGKVLDEIIIEAPSLPVQLKIAKLLDNLNELEVKTRLHISSLNNVKSLYLNLLFI